MLNNESSFYEIAKDILVKFSDIFVSRPYIAIIDASADVHYMDDSPIEQYLKFLQHFIKQNYYLLKTGDHSLPLSGTNLGIFKLSPKVFIVLYIAKGPAGQLLSFKAKMNQWAHKLDELIGDLEIVESSIEDDEGTLIMIKGEKPQHPTRVMKGKGFKEIPFLMKKLKGNEKFPVKDGSVINLCDGVHSVEEIAKETRLNKIVVKEIIRQYVNKKWIEMKRVLL